MTGEAEVAPTTDVFVSYSRNDQEFVRRLHDALTEHGRECWVDWEDIPPTAKWKEEIQAAIESAQAFAFVISPGSVNSIMCREEVQHAERHNKRIIPLLRASVEDPDVPESIGVRNWISFQETDDFQASLAKLLRALDTDLEWAKSHTRLLVRAVEWDANGRDRSFALRGRDLEAAEHWLTQVEAHKELLPTQLQTEYIIGSRRATARGQRIRIVALSIGVAVATILATLALIQRERAEEQSRIARSRELAAGSLLQLDSEPELSLLLATEAGKVARTTQAEEAIRLALNQSLPIRVLSSHQGPVNAAVFSPDGKQVMTGGDDGQAVIRDVETGRAIAVFEPGAGKIAGVDLSPDGESAVTASTVGHVWDISSRESQVLDGHGRRLTSASFSPDGERILTTSYDRSARVWDAQTGDPLVVFREHPGPVFSGTFSPDGRLALTASGVPQSGVRAPGTAHVWRVDTGRTVQTLRVRRSDINDASFSPDGSAVVTASDDGVARVWSVGSGEELASLPRSEDLLYSAAFSPDGERIVTASLDGSARVWNWQQTPILLLQVLGGHGGPVNAAVFSPSESRSQVVTAGGDGNARVWDAGGEQVVTFDGHARALLGVAFGVEDNVAATTDSSGYVRLWSTSSGKEMRSIVAHKGAAFGVDVGPDGKLLVTASYDGTTRIWDLASGDQVTLDHETVGVVYSAEFSPDGQRVVTTNALGTARIWESQTGEEIAPPLRGHEGFVYAGTFSPDGRTIATGGQDDLVRLWDAATGDELARLVGHTGDVRSVDFSPDGSELVSASDDKTVRLWDLQSGRTTFVLRGHTGRVSDAEFSPAGDRIVTASVDGTARLWSWNSRVGRLLDVHQGHIDVVQAAAFSPDGGQVATASYDGTGRVFECDLCVPFEELLGIAERTVSRELSPLERSQYLHGEEV